MIDMFGAILGPVSLDLVEAFPLQTVTPFANGALFIAFYFFVATSEAATSYTAAIMRVQIDVRIAVAER